jgi:hypothetical protein
MISSNKHPKQELHLAGCLDADITTEEESDDYEYEDNDEDDKEFAYQCDFQKKSLPDKPCSQQSLLSNLLSSNRLPQQEQNRSLTKSPVRGDITADPLSESLKRNLEWEHHQNSMRKCRDVKEKIVTLEEFSCIDNFCRW